MKQQVEKELTPETVELIQEKAAGSSLAEAILKVIAYRMRPIRFRMFCEHVPIGGPLVQEIQREKFVGDLVVGWRRFALEVVKRVIRKGARLGPQHCKQTPEQRLAQFRLHSRRGTRYTAMHLDAMLAANFGQQPELDQVRHVFCVGCQQRGCPHHLVPAMRIAAESGTHRIGEDTNEAQPKPPRRLRLVHSA